MKLGMKVHVWKICKLLEMQRDCALHIAGRGHLTSFSVEYETGNQSLFECAESFTKEELRYTCHYAVFENNINSCQFERGRIISMMETVWSARQVARQSRYSDYVARRCLDQWIREMSFTRRPDSERPRQTSHQEDRHIVRDARIQPTASSATIKAHVAPSLASPASS
ncbi:uncharacterized protein TNCV_686681 [Trichonephila clavipes]|nr:uncharacterized protein TNCV_686681 [Trichonephila clavipes]